MSEKTISAAPTIRLKRTVRLDRDRFQKPVTCEVDMISTPSPRALQNRDHPVAGENLLPFRRRCEIQQTFGGSLRRSQSDDAALAVESIFPALYVLRRRDDAAQRQDFDVLPLRQH